MTRSYAEEVALKLGAASLAVTENASDGDVLSLSAGEISFGSQSAVGVLLGSSTQIDLSVATAHTPIWDQMFNNTYDFNSIPFVFPDELGITYSAEEATYTITEDGSWWFDLSITFPPDSDLILDIEPCFFGALAETTYGPGLGAGRNGHTWLHWGSVVRFVAGATPLPVVRVFTPATRIDPDTPFLTLTVQATIERVR